MADVLEQPKIEEKDIFSDENLKPVDVSSLFVEKKDVQEKPKEAEKINEAATTEKKEAEKTFDGAEFIKKEFGVDSADAIKQQLDELKQLKEKQDKKYETQNLADKDKEDEIYNALHEKRTLANVDKLDAEAAIKLNLQRQNKDYTPEEIQDLYEEKYSLTPKPEQGDMQTDDEYQNSIAQWQKKNDKEVRRIERAAKDAKTDLTKQLSEIVLPYIQKAEQKENVLSQEELVNIQKIRDAYLQSLETGTKKFNDFTVTYKDEEVELPISVKVDESKKKALHERLQNGFDFQNYWLDRYSDEKGNWNAEKLEREMYLLENLEEILSGVAHRSASERLTEAEKRRNNISLNGNSKRVANIQSTEHMDRMAEKFFNS